MRILDLFSGFGGFALAAGWTWPDHEIAAFVEIEPFAQRWLRANWPGVPIISDIRDCNYETLFNGSLADTDGNGRWATRPQGNVEHQSVQPSLCCAGQGETDGRHHNPGSRSDANRFNSNHPEGKTYDHPTTTIDLLTGGFPCQPFSVAGKKKGTEDNRFLWPQMLRVIREVRPRWIVAENVPGIDDKQLVLDRVCSDLEDAGYQVGPPLQIPACAVNAPHRRDRVWIVANAEQQRCQGSERPKLRGVQTGRHKQVVGSDRQGSRPGGPCGMADTKGSGQLRAPEHENDGSDCQRGRRYDLTDNGEDMADTGKPGLERRQPGANRTGDVCKERVSSAGHGQWADSEWITGHDGKARRVKPGVRLLANGFPHRNDLLRGFGNAIVPQVAARIFEAIKAAEEG